MFQHHLGQMQLHSAPWQRCANVSDGSPEVDMIEPTKLSNAKTQNMLCHDSLLCWVVPVNAKKKSSRRASGESVWMPFPTYSFLVRWQIIQWCIELGGWVLQWFEVYQWFLHLWHCAVTVLRLILIFGLADRPATRKMPTPRTIPWRDCPQHPTWVSCKMIKVLVAFLPA